MNTQRETRKLAMVAVVTAIVAVAPIVAGIAPIVGSASAQVLTGQYNGQVQLQDGSSPGAGVTVTARGIENGNQVDSATASTDSNGEFTVGIEESDEVEFFVEGNFQKTVQWIGGPTDGPTLTVDQNDLSGTPFFDVTIDNTSSPVTQGETLEVNATITNSNPNQDISGGTQTVTLNDTGFDNTQVDSEEVTLAAGATKEVTLSFDTTGKSTQTGEVTVASENTTDDAQVEIQQAANFDVTIDSATDPANINNNLNVTATVENTGGATDTQSINLTDDGGAEVDSTSVELNGGETESVNLALSAAEIETGDIGLNTLTVSSEDDSDTREVRIFEEPEFFDVTITDTNAESGSPLGEGETLEVTADVENTGDLPGTQEISLNFSGELVDNESVQLDPEDAAQKITLTHQTESGDGTVETVSVESENASNSTGVSIVQPANFTVNITDFDSPITENETASVTVNVSNEGEATDTQDIELSSQDFTDQDNTSVQLDGGNNETVVLELKTEYGEATTGTVIVESDDGNTDSAEIEVRATSFFNATIDSTNSPVVDGDDLVVNATVENEGSAEVEQEVNLTGFDKNVVDTQTVNLPGGEINDSIRLRYDTTGVLTPDEEFNESDISVTTANTTATEQVRIDAPPANFTVNITDVESPITENETANVTVNVSNEGGRTDTQNITLTSANFTDENSSEVEIAPGNNSTVELELETEYGEADTGTITVTSDDGNTDTAGIEVQATSFFNVSIDNTNSPVTGGDDLVVNTTVENEGSAQATQDVTLTNVTGDVLDTNSVTLSGTTENDSVQLSFNTAGILSGERNNVSDITVSTANTSETTSREVGAEEANFSVNITSIESGVPEGDDVDVTAEINNTGGLSGTQTVNLTINGTQETEQDIQLNFDENTTETFTFSTNVGNAGSFTASVNSEDDSDSRSFLVNAIELFNITDATTNSPVVAGNNLSVTATVENEGSAQGEQQIELTEIDGPAVEDTAVVNLSSGGSSSVTLQFNTSGQAGVSGTVNVSSANDTLSESVSVVEDPANFSVNITDTNSPVDEGNALNVDVRVDNVGDLQATQEITLNATEFTGAIEDTTDPVTLAAGGSENVTLAFTSTSGNDGTGNITVSSLNTSDAAEVTINQDSGGGGGGGGASDEADDGPATVQDVKDTLNLVQPTADTEADITDSDAEQAGSNVNIQGSSSVRQISFNNEELTGSVQVTDYGQPPETVEEQVTESVSNNVEGTDQDSINVISVTDITTTAGATEDTSATVEMTVDAAAVNDPSQLVVYKETFSQEAQTEQWEQLDTSVVETGDEEIVLEVQPESFSLFAVTEIDDGGEETTGEPQDDGQTETGDDGSTDDGIPGFGAIAALVAIVAAALAAYRKTE